MSVYRVFLLFLFYTVSIRAAEPLELRPLKGDKLKGNLVSLNDKEIVLQVDGKPQITPTEQTLQLDFGPIASLKDQKYTEVQLVDGSLLRCTNLAFKGKEITVTLLSGQAVKVPMSSIGQIMNEANDLKLATEWKSLFAGKKRSYDVVVARTSAGGLNQLEGTFYEASEDGKQIEFTLKGSDTKTKLMIDNIFGMVFLRPPDPNLPSLLCKLYDTQGSTITASSVVLKDGTFTVTTQCRVKLEFGLPLLAKLDYSKGKLTYLSDFELSRVRVVENSPLGTVQHFRRDKNLDGEGSLQIAGKTYPKGLALHAYCELVFDLEGEYREFQAVAGVDDRVGQGSDGPTTLRIEGDGKELLNIGLARKDGARPITLNIRDVQKLRIIVISDDILGLGRHLDLAEAKVSK
jgi:hypothetical protein